MEEVQIANVCKVMTMKIENFDEAMPVVQVCVGKFGILERCIIGWWIQCENHFWNLKKLGLRKPLLVPFVVKMAN